MEEADDVAVLHAIVDRSDLFRDDSVVKEETKQAQLPPGVSSGYTITIR